MESRHWYESDLCIFVLQICYSPDVARKEWENHLSDVLDILKEGSKVAKETAAKTLEDVRHSMRIDYFTDNNLLK